MRCRLVLVRLSADSFPSIPPWLDALLTFLLNKLTCNASFSQCSVLLQGVKVTSVLRNAQYHECQSPSAPLEIQSEVRSTVPAEIQSEVQSTAVAAPAEIQSEVRLTAAAAPAEIQSELKSG